VVFLFIKFSSRSNTRQEKPALGSKFSAEKKNQHAAENQNISNIVMEIRPFIL